jgi:PPK2 family polyphosphate:nucleotide phosphotransferase
MNLSRKLIVEPGSKARIAERDPDATAGFRKSDADEILAERTRRLAELQYLLYAENRRAVLIVIQAMDAGGKDGTIRHVMSGLNPQGCRVASFKVPSAEEADHDFLWRIHKEVPPKGEFGIFNRSHYEDVLVVRVHGLVPAGVWRARYDQINAFEALLAANDVTILKFFLHISKEEQLERFRARLEDPTRRWKLSGADFAERDFWDDYVKAYEDALTRCSTKHAPWFVIPANHKWYRNLAISSILVETLEALDMKFPEPKIDLSGIQLR